MDIPTITNSVLIVTNLVVGPLKAKRMTVDDVMVFRRLGPKCEECSWVHHDIRLSFGVVFENGQRITNASGSYVWGWSTNLTWHQEPDTWNLTDKWKLIQVDDRLPVFERSVFTKSELADFYSVATNIAVTANDITKAIR